MRVLERLSLVSLVLLLGIAFVVEANLITNGDFELPALGAPNTFGVPEGWAFNPAGGMTNSTDYGEEGNQVGFLNGLWTGWQTNDTYVVEGTTYTLQGDIGLRNDATEGAVHLYADNGSGTLSLLAEFSVSQTPISYEDNGNEWTYAWTSGADTYTADGAYAGQLLRYEFLMVDGTGQIYFDNLVLTDTSSSTLPGDLNDDGFVGGDDLDIVRSFWGQYVTPGDLLQGDPSEDGFVGGDDLDIVRANWGQGTPPAPTAIPEPATMTFLVAGVLALWAFGRRK